MEKRVDSIVFRRLTYADFRHINKIGKEEIGGGGQSYIDFPTKDISIKTWYKFLGENTGFGKHDRPQWDFMINSIGLKSPKNIRIFQRRPASVCIASQKIHSKESNRVLAWHPSNSFPEEYNPDVENLVIYIVKTTNGEFWAGWFLKNDIPKDWSINDFLRRLFIEDSAGYIKFRKKVFIDTANKMWPFYFDAKTSENLEKSEDDIAEDLIEEDTSIRLQDLKNVKPEIRERLLKIRKRNPQIVNHLKALYGNKCQLTGEKYTFLKKDGKLYSEVHHLIPLGEQGSDSYANAIVVSPLIHKMLHYANVSKIDLTKIQNNKLPIIINDKMYEITWHSDHIKTVENSLED